MSRFSGISQKIIDFIVYRRKLIEKVFILLTVISAISFPFVGINYDLSKYLPESTSSKQGINLMEDTFGYPGTARVMIKDVSIYEAKNYKNKIANMDGVDMVTWADTKADVYQSSLFIQYQDIKDYYKDKSAVMDIVFDEGDSSKLTHQAIDKIKALLGDKGYLSGSAVQDKFLGESLNREMASTMVIAVIVIAVILSLATTSWFEPLIFMLVIFIAIVINMGSNIFLGNISFLTFSCAALLQLAIAMDYTIILLDAFTRERTKGLAPEPAVANAIRASIIPISSAGAAAFVGFTALTLMRFSIGRDLGIVLAKGIAISLVTIVFLMPALILRWYDKIEKLTHKPFVPSFHGLAKKVYQLRYFIVIISLVIAIPSFVAKEMNSFTFGNDAMGSSPGTVVHEDEQAINKEFGRKNLLMLLIPDTSLVTEKRLSDELDALDYTNSVTSLAGTLPEGVPESFLPTSLTRQLHRDGYARILVTLRTASESDLAFKSTDEIRKIVKKYYPNNSYVIGITPSTQDIKSVIVDDYTNIDLLSLLGVALAIALAYRSLSLPIVLMIPIQIAVFINMAVPYIFGDKLMYMGYIIVSCLQLGATIDYSILMTNHYLEFRKTLPKKEASIEATAASALPILTSGLILAAAGYGLYFSSSVSAVADLGRLVGRGALFSMLLVLLLLPNLFLISDRFIWEKRRIMKMNRVRRISAGVMLFCMLATMLPTGSYAGAPSVSVDETLYVNLDYYGAISDVNVVKGSSLNGNKEYVDYGNYEKVTNMTNTIAPVVKAGKVQWKLGEMDKDRFYFQGTLKNNAVVLPWKLDISYKLNGVPTKAEKLAGASGLVEINIKAVPNQAASQYYKSNMMLTATTLINMEDSYSIEAPGAQLQSMGTYKAVVFAAMPGEETTFTIRVGSDSFESSGVTLAMIPGTLEQLKNIKELKEAKDTVKDSTDAIYDSMNSMLGTFDSMSGSLTTLQSGLYDFENARKTISSSKGDLNDKGDLARAELPRLSQQLNTMIPYMKTGREFIQTVNGKVYDIVDNVAGTKTTLNKFSASINTIQGDLTDFRNMGEDLQDKNDQRLELMDNLDSDVQGLDSLLNLYASNLTELKNSQAGLKTALGTQLSGMQGITPETLLAINNFLKTTDNTITNMQYTIAAGRQLSSSVKKMLSLSRDYMSIIESRIDTADSLLKESISMVDTATEAIKTANDLIDKTVDLNNTMNNYEDDALNLLTETEKMLTLTSASLTSVNNYLDSLQTMMDKSGDYMDPGTRKSIQGMLDLTKKSLAGIKTLPTIRRANDTIKRTVDKEVDKFEDENKFLNLDAEAPLVSFTSNKNPTPASTQIVLRSKEISLDSVDNNSDLEPIAKDPGVFARIVKLFDKLWNGITSLFAA